MGRATEKYRERESEREGGKNEAKISVMDRKKRRRGWRESEETGFLDGESNTNTLCLSVPHTHAAAY